MRRNGAARGREKGLRAVMVLPAQRMIDETAACRGNEKTLARPRTITGRYARAGEAHTLSIRLFCSDRIGEILTTGMDTPRYITGRLTLRHMPHTSGCGKGKEPRVAGPTVTIHLWSQSWAVLSSPFARNRRLTHLDDPVAEQHMTDALSEANAALRALREICDRYQLPHVVLVAQTMENSARVIVAAKPFNGCGGVCLFNRLARLVKEGSSGAYVVINAESGDEVDTSES